MIHEDDTLLAHEPDHIIAVKHRGRIDANNLAWACFLCNRLKGSKIASVDLETGQVVRLFILRLDDWIAHFRPATLNRRRPISTLGDGWQGVHRYCSAFTSKGDLLADLAAKPLILAQIWLLSGPVHA